MEKIIMIDQVGDWCCGTVLLIAGIFGQLLIILFLRWRLRHK